MQVTATNIRPASDATIAEAARLLRAGRLVAFPTETVYGLGADATNADAVASIFAAKARPRFNPLIAHVADANAAREQAVFNDKAETLAETFWPGALTLVLPRRGGCAIALLASAGLDTVALRVPDHPVATRLLTAVARPVAAPSANPSGRLSPTTAHHVADGLGDKVDLIVDGGPTQIGIESTVIGFGADGSPLLLRPGGIDAEAIETAVGPLGRPDGGAGRPTSPGQLESHYAPRLPLRLEATDAAPDEALLAFGPDAPAGAAVTANLSPRGDLQEAAARLFDLLHQLDAAPVKRIAVMPIPAQGLGRAINDRLQRAAAPRR